MQKILLCKKHVFNIKTFTLFLFLITANFLGMTLYSFTITSHVTVTFTLGFAIFIGVVILGIMVQKLEFVNNFVPSGAPMVLLPFLVVIEIISYLLINNNYWH